MSTPDPQTVGRYQVVNRLGAGAMGVVYLCQDPLLKRKVAVKTVKAGHGNSDAILARFQRESEISAQLNHPNIITVFDVGNDEAIGPYLTMELVDGCSLGALINDTPMDPRQAIQLLAQGAQALVAAEHGGVVHRDVKPENILVSKDGRLKLTDFGVARDESSTLTTTGVVMGTPTHTAPELLAGSIANPGTDRYAFGVMAYQMFTGGGLPHPGETISSVLTHIVNELPVIPEDMPPAAARTFLKALHKDPARRFDSLLQFLESLADSYGVRDALSTAGLSPMATPLPSESGTQEVSRMKTDARSSTGGTRGGSATSSRSSQDGITGQPSPTAAKLMGPPTDLLRAGRRDPLTSEDPTGPHESPRAPISLAQDRIGTIHPEATRRLKARPQVDENRQMRLVLMLLVVVAGLVGWSWYKSQAPTVSAIPMSVDVITSPSGAFVTIDGNGVASTPIFALELPAMQHSIIITLNGYETYSASFSPKKPLDSKIVLKPKAAGDDPPADH